MKSAVYSISAVAGWRPGVERKTAQFYCLSRWFLAGQRLAEIETEFENDIRVTDSRSDAMQSIRLFSLCISISV